MRRSRWKPIVFWCSSWLLLPAAGATLPQTAPASVSPAQTPATSRSNAPEICFDQLYFWALPGKTNYCLGLRDWNNGRYGSGLELLKLAAGWGNKSAQYTLGMIYYGGRHVHVNPALGIAWLKLADQRHNDPLISLATRSAVKWATPAQRQRGEALFQQMRAQYGDRVATARAWHHLRHWEQRYGSNSGTLCLYGAQLYAVRRAGLQGMGPPGVSRAIQAARSMRNNKRHKKQQGAKAQSCFGISLQMQRHVVQKSADTYFAGWMGTVSVGPLKSVPAPAASSGH